MEVTYDTIYATSLTRTGEIRLLTVLPGQATDLLHCELACSNLSLSPAYAALSYTWGDPSTTNDVLINDTWFPVTVSLASALRHLRSPTESQCIWADAVCINQKDILEKSHQVRGMRQVYKCAERVIAWLGEEQECDRDVVALIETIHQKEPELKLAPKRLENSITRDSLLAIDGLLKRPYWSRAWIVQEYLLNRNVTAQCGTLSFPWRHLDFSQPLDLGQETLLCVSRDLARMLRNSGAGSPGDPGVNGIHEPSQLLSTLVWYRQLHATDPRDKIYAFLGLIVTGCPEFPVDYTRDLRMVYTDVVRYLITHARKLDVIGVTQSSKRTPSLPSWVPDWQPQPESSAVNLLRLRPEDPLFSATKSLSAKCSVSDDGRILTVEGLCVGSVDMLGKPCLVPNMDEDEAHKLAGLQAFDDWHRLVASSVGIDARTMIEFCRVISCDYSCSSNRSASRNISPEENARECVSYFQSIIEDLDVSTLSLPQYLTQFLDTEGDSGSLKDVMSSATGTVFMQDRRFFLSSSGHIGLVPSSTESGDIVCLILGCAHPMILRPVGHAFMVVGEGFVNDLMYGEGLEATISSQTQEFSLI